MSIRARLPGLLLIAGGAFIAITIPVALGRGVAAKELPWIAGTAIFVIAAAYLWRRVPQHPVAWWLAVSAGLVGIVQFLDGLLLHLGAGADLRLMAWLTLLYQMVTGVTVIAIAHLLALFPDGRLHRDYERRLLRSAWWLLVLPPVVFVGRPTLLLPGYHMLPDLPNLYFVSALTQFGSFASVGVAILQAVFAVGVFLLVARYRRSSGDARRRIRWLILPALLAAVVAVMDLVLWRLFPDGAPSAAAEVGVSALWILVIASLPTTIAIAIVRPNLLDVDRVIRKSLVHGFLWTLIAVSYVVAAAGLGLAAGRRFPLGLAILLTVVATVMFQPARRRLESLADRWVFGDRTDPARLIARLGAALEDTIDLESLLPRMAETLRTGLGVEWARVSLEPTPNIDGAVPALTVPIVLEDRQVGVVECGPKESGPISDEDTAVVTTLARQAALAVRNVRLTAELEQSRTRLVRAQEKERRRIERNIHDGVQQDLVALIGQAAHLRGLLNRDPVTGEQAAVELQQGLRRVIGELRELARGIHPSVLSDRGLLEAIEALAARSSVPVSVRADPALRGARFAEEVEGAGYFTIAEALANIGKHAAASHVSVSLAPSDGVLQIEVRDDGAGFDVERVAGGGLTNLAERLAALGGRLDVSSSPGRGTTVTAQLRVASG